MTRAAIAAACAVASALALAPPAGASKPCHPHGSKTIRATASARVYERNHQVFGCLRSRGRGYPLGHPWDDDVTYGYGGVHPIRLSGRFVGYASQYGSHYGEAAATVSVMDLRTGKVRSSAYQHGGAYQSCDPPGYEVTDLAVAPTGGVAWIARVGHCDGVRFEVDTLAAEASQAVVDDSRVVDGSSLYFRGGSIFWRRSDTGEQRSAPLR
jgi:hypothetical protein